MEMRISIYHVIIVLILWNAKDIVNKPPTRVLFAIANPAQEYIKIIVIKGEDRYHTTHTPKMVFVLHMMIIVDVY